MAHNIGSTDSRTNSKAGLWGVLRTSLAIFGSDGIKLAKVAKTSKVEGMCDSEVWNPESLMKRIFIWKKRRRKKKITGAVCITSFATLRA